jgi:hypothetical protein
MPVVRGLELFAIGEMVSIAAVQIMETVIVMPVRAKIPVVQAKWVAISLIRGVCMTCWAMSGNGVGMSMTMMPIPATPGITQ